jgi:hypothetical protein
MIEFIAALSIFIAGFSSVILIYRSFSPITYYLTGVTLYFGLYWVSLLVFTSGVEINIINSELILLYTITHIVVILICDYFFLRKTKINKNIKDLFYSGISEIDRRVIAWMFTLLIAYYVYKYSIYGTLISGVDLRGDIDKVASGFGVILPMLIDFFQPLLLFWSTIKIFCNKGKKTLEKIIFISLMLIAFSTGRTLFLLYFLSIILIMLVYSRVSILTYIKSIAGFLMLFLFFIGPLFFEIRLALNNEIESHTEGMDVAYSNNIETRMMDSIRFSDRIISNNVINSDLKSMYLFRVFDFIIPSVFLQNGGEKITTESLIIKDIGGQKTDESITLLAATIAEGNLLYFIASPIFFVLAISVELLFILKLLKTYRLIAVLGISHLYLNLIMVGNDPLWYLLHVRNFLFIIVFTIFFTMIKNIFKITLKRPT